MPHDIHLSHDKTHGHTEGHTERVVVARYSDLVEMGMPLGDTFKCEVCNNIFPIVEIMNFGILLFCGECEEDAVNWHDEIIDRIRNGDLE